MGKRTPEALQGLAVLTLGTAPVSMRVDAAVVDGRTKSWYKLLVKSSVKCISNFSVRRNHLGNLIDMQVTIQQSGGGLRFYTVKELPQ